MSNRGGDLEADFYLDSTNDYGNRSSSAPPDQHLLSQQGSMARNPFPLSQQGVGDASSSSSAIDQGHYLQQQQQHHQQQQHWDPTSTSLRHVWSSTPNQMVPATAADGSKMFEQEPGNNSPRHVLHGSTMARNTEALTHTSTILFYRQQQHHIRPIFEYAFQNRQSINTRSFGTLVGIA